jgi:hypothetical protein
MDQSSFGGGQDAIQSRTSSLRKANRHWNISFTFLYDHLGGKTINKKPRPIGVLTKEENKVVVAWILIMQEVGFINNLTTIENESSKIHID